jgi:hypothetical protein
MLTQHQKNTAIGGYMCGLSLGAIRLASAQTWQDFVVTGSLTAVELSAVKVLETRTAEIAEKQEAWQVKEESRGSAIAAVRVAEDRHAALCRERQNTIDEMERLERECEDEFLLSDPKGLTSICTAAMLRGYRRGIARNAGILSGLPEEAFDDD